MVTNNAGVVHAVFKMVCDLAKLHGGSFIDNEVNEERDEGRDASDGTTQGPPHDVVLLCERCQLQHLLSCGVDKAGSP